MLRKVLNFIVLLPLAIILIVFAVANRHFVTVSFDPFDAANDAAMLRLPLFVVILLAAILGVVAGGMATWLGQRHWRKAARRHEADAVRVRQQLFDRQADQARSAHPAAMLNPPV